MSGLVNIDVDRDKFPFTSLPVYNFEYLFLECIAISLGLSIVFQISYKIHINREHFIILPLLLPFAVIRLLGSVLYSYFSSHFFPVCHLRGAPRNLTDSIW